MGKGGYGESKSQGPPFSVNTSQAKQSKPKQYNTITTITVFSRRLDKDESEQGERRQTRRHTRQVYRHIRVNEGGSKNSINRAIQAVTRNGQILSVFA